MVDRRADPLDPAGLRDREALTPARVVAFLRAHPDFLLRHPELVDELLPPAPERGRGVVDLQQFMLARLQDEIRRLKGEQRALIQATRANLQSQTRVHAAALTLLSARSFEHLVQLLTTDLALLLGVDVVGLCVETETGHLPRVEIGGLHALAPGDVDAFLGAGKDVLLEGDTTGDPVLFGSGAGLVRSAALIRLQVGPTAPPCLLVVGARVSDRFHSGQGTELLAFLGRIGGLAIRSWLDLPSS